MPQIAFPCRTGVRPLRYNGGLHRQRNLTRTAGYSATARTTPLAILGAFDARVLDAAPDASVRMDGLMKIVLLLVLLLVTALVVSLAARRRVAREEAAAALARARAQRQSRIPVVSNNLKGVTSSQTIKPYRAAPPDDPDERAA
jgi:hypothetical protein